MSMPHLPPEVWIRVLSFLRDPIPSYLSDPPRSAMIHPDLVYAGRVCKLFHSIVHPLIYTHAITDNFHGFCAALDPSGDGKFAKASLVQTLHLEYAQKADHISYLGLFAVRHRDELWERIGAIAQKARKEKKARKANTTASCAHELRRLIDCFVLLSRKGGDTSVIFPNLRTISVGTLYSIDAWGDINHKFTGTRILPSLDHTRDPINICEQLFTKFIHTSNIQQLCLRNVGGPLILSSKLEHPLDPSYTCTIHAQSHDENIPLPFGGPVCWINEDPIEVGAPLEHISESMKNTQFPTVIDDVLHRLPIKLDIHSQLVMSSEEAKMWDEDSERLVVSVEEEARGQEEIDVTLNSHKLRMGAERLPDTVGYHLSETAPLCEACGCGESTEGIKWG